jgi:hypothetical protein
MHEVMSMLSTQNKSKSEKMEALENKIDDLEFRANSKFHNAIMRGTAGVVYTSLAGFCARSAYELAKSGTADNLGGHIVFALLGGMAVLSGVGLLGSVYSMYDNCREYNKLKNKSEKLTANMRG